MAKSRNPIFTGVTGKFGEFVVTQINGRAVLRARPVASRKQSQRQDDCRSAHAQRAQAWRALPDGVKRKWGLLGLQMTDWERKRAADGLSGYLAFQSVNAWRQSLRLPLVSEPEPVPVYPPSLCPVELNGFVLTSAGFPHAVQIYAAPPALPNCPQPLDSKFAVLTLLPELPVGGCDLEAMCVNKYGADWDGAQVWIKLTPVAPEGFAGRTVTRTAMAETM